MHEKFTRIHEHEITQIHEQFGEKSQFYWLIFDAKKKEYKGIFIGLQRVLLLGNYNLFLKENKKEIKEESIYKN